MVELKDLAPGMKIKIVDEWVPGCRQNYGGGMDHWLGKIVTVKEIRNTSFIIEEDYGECRLQSGHWHWFPNAVDYIVYPDNDLPDIDDAAAEAILQFLFPGV